jgi:hypothetical protein
MNEFLSSHQKLPVLSFIYFLSLTLSFAVQITVAIHTTNATTTTTAPIQITGASTVEGILLFVFLTSDFLNHMFFKQNKRSDPDCGCVGYLNYRTKYRWRKHWLILDKEKLYIFKSKSVRLLILFSSFE